MPDVWLSHFLTAYVYHFNNNVVYDDNMTNVDLKIRLL